MNKLETLKNMGFKISWKLINIGLHGLEKIPTILTYDELLDYFNNQLTNINKETEDIITLVCTSENILKFNKLLEEFANRDESNVIIQIRKWRVYLLKNIIDNISKDYLQGLLELMEFWISMGRTEKCPHIFPDEMQKENYFTPNMYELLLKRNSIWLAEEIADIIKCELKTVGDGGLS